MAITKKLIEMVNDVGIVKSLIDTVTKKFNENKATLIKKMTSQVEPDDSRSETATGRTFRVETDYFKATVSEKTVPDKKAVMATLMARPEYKDMTPKEAKAIIERRYIKASFDLDEAFNALTTKEQKAAKTVQQRLTLTAIKGMDAKIEQWNEDVSEVFNKIELSDVFKTGDVSLE